MWSPVSFFFVVLRCHLRVTLFPYTTLFRSVRDAARADSEIGGRGVSVYSGARLEATGLLIERCAEAGLVVSNPGSVAVVSDRSEKHTSELQSPCNLVCRLLLEKKKIKSTTE